MNFEFHIYLWDRPIDEILPWYAGQQRAVGINEDTRKFLTKGRVGIYEHPKGTSVPTFSDAPSICSDGDKRRPFWDTRLIQVKGSKNVTVLEAAFDLEDLGGGDAISRLAGAQFLSFRYGEQDNKPFVTHFKVGLEDEFVRGVTAHGSEATPSPSAWSFHQKGPPMSWEKTERYSVRKKIDRLTREHLIEYMSCVGLDYNNYRLRRFDRVVDFGPGPDSKDIVGYDEHALKVFDAMEAKFADLGLED